MKRVIETVKNLYKGENPFKKHILYSLLMIIPALAGAVISYGDKDTPKAVWLTLLCIGGVLFLLSIIPYIIMAGFRYTFLNDRYNGVNEGIPEVSFELFKRGLYAIPFDFVWGIYMSILAIVVVGSSLIPMFYGIFSHSARSNVPLVVCLTILTIFLYILGIIILCLICAFFVYVSIEYAKDFKYKKRLFNPLLLFDAIRKSFKSTFITAIKYLLGSMVVQTIVSIICGLIYVAVILSSGIILALSLPENAALEYHPVYMIVVFVGATLLGVLTTYAYSVFWLGYSDNVVDVYKSEIEPTLQDNEF